MKMYIDWQRIYAEVDGEIKRHNAEKPDWDDEYYSNEDVICKVWSGGPEVLTNVEPRRVPLSLLKATDDDLEYHEIETEYKPDYMEGMSLRALEANGVAHDFSTAFQNILGVVIEKTHVDPSEIRCGTILHVHHHEKETRRLNPDGMTLYVAWLGPFGSVYVVPCDLIDWEKLPGRLCTVHLIICLHQIVAPRLSLCSWGIFSFISSIECLTRGYFNS